MAANQERARLDAQVREEYGLLNVPGDQVKGFLGLNSPAPAESDDQRFVYQDDEIIEKDFDLQQFRRLFSYLAPYRTQVLLALLVMLISSGTQLAGPYILRLAVDNALTPKNLHNLYLYGGIMLAVQVTAWVAGFFRYRLTSRVGQRAIRDMRGELFRHIAGLSFDFFSARPAGKIMVRIANDVNSLQDLFTNGIVNSLSDMITLVGIIVIMVSWNIELALATFVVLPFMVFLSTGLRRRIRKAWQRVRRRLSSINAHLNESIQGMRVTHAFAQEDNNLKFFKVMNYSYFKTFMDAMNSTALFRPLVEFTGAVGNAIVYLFGTYLLIRGSMSLGELVGFIFYLGLFWQPVSRLGQVYQQLLVAMASSERIFDYMDMPPAVSDSPDAYQLPPVEGEVHFDHLTFAYDEGRPVLHDIDFKVQPGETIAIVGETGSGKTTITHLIGRFYDPQQGRVLIDGHDVRDVTLDSLRTQISVVMQDTFIFSGTVRENIKYANPDASETDVVRAAKAVRADEFIRRLSNGYDTEVKERGTRLSVGQRQLLSFARAILADPRILILDEATASIDTQTELLIQEALETLLQDRTAFVVAHRLSTIRNADRIIVLDQGRIIEMGDHASLFQERGEYYKLLQAQFRSLA